MTVQDATNARWSYVLQWPSQWQWWRVLTKHKISSTIKKTTTTEKNRHW